MEHANHRAQSRACDKLEITHALPQKGAYSAASIRPVCTSERSSPVAGAWVPLSCSRLIALTRCGSRSMRSRRVLQLSSSSLRPTPCRAFRSFWRPFSAKMTEAKTTDAKG